MKLSIIVPVYNMASDGKLEYCLNSLVHQTITDYEILAVDDASTDNSYEILKSYEAQYPFFHAIHSEVNKKQGGAKNIGLSQAQGDWIGFIDSDDWITPDMYERLIRLGEETQADIAGCDYGLTEEHSMTPGRRVANNTIEQAGELNREKYKSLILDGGSLVVKVYRRHLIFDYDTRFPEGIFYEDNAIANSWILRAKRFAYIPEPLYYYYQHETSTVHTITPKRCEDRMEAAELMLKEAKKEGYFEEYKEELEYSFTLLFFVNTLFSYMQGVTHKKLSFVKKLVRRMQELFPKFTENVYYQKRLPAEDKKWVAYCLRSPFCFYVYYQVKQAYWNFRKNR